MKMYGKQEDGNSLYDKYRHTIIHKLTPVHIAAV